LIGTGQCAAPHKYAHALLAPPGSSAAMGDASGGTIFYAQAMCMLLLVIAVVFVCRWFFRCARLGECDCDPSVEDGERTRLLERTVSTRPRRVRRGRCRGHVPVLTMPDEERAVLVVAGETCPICLDPFTEEEALTRLSCSHAFHRKCILTWFGVRASCPQCRRCQRLHS
jgi:hypothetical protein